MRFLSAIEKPLAIERILRRLRRWDPRPPGQPPPTTMTGRSTARSPWPTSLCPALP